MTTPTVRAVQMGATLVCSHILAGEPPTGEVTLREAVAWNYVRLCDTCTRLSRVPGGLTVLWPKAPETPRPRTRTALDNYITPPPHEERELPDGVQRYELVITATGVVKDKDGNVISSEPIEARALLTEDELKAQIESMNKEKP